MGIDTGIEIVRRTEFFMTVKMCSPTLAHITSFLHK